MMQCDGYLMCVGDGQYIPKEPGGPSPIFHGTWLFRPDTRMWVLGNCPVYPWGTTFEEDEIRIISEVE